MNLKPMSIPVVLLTVFALRTFYAAAAEPVPSGNRGFSAGLYNSVKGFGPAVEFQLKSGSYCDICIIADTYDVFFNEVRQPGIRGSFYYNTNLIKWEQRFCDIELFAGPGVFAGYGRDASREPGFYFTLNANGGFRFVLRPDITFIVSLELGLGLHLGHDNLQSYNKLHLYKYGILNSWMPQLTVLYTFRKR